MRMHRAMLLATAVAVLAAPTAHAAGSWRPAWWSYDRPAQYAQVTTHVSVPARDGTPISCDLSLPGASSTQPAPGTFPAIFADYTPYEALTPTFNSGDGAYFAEHGYAVLICVVRGSRTSG